MTAEMKAKVNSDIEEELVQFEKFGLGIFYLFLSMVPANIVFVAKMAAGMEAD
jgi:hypothetical protein